MYIYRTKMSQFLGEEYKFSMLPKISSNKHFLAKLEVTVMLCRWCGSLEIAAAAAAGSDVTRVLHLNLIRSYLLQSPVRIMEVGIFFGVLL